MLHSTAWDVGCTQARQGHATDGLQLRAQAMPTLMHGDPGADTWGGGGTEQMPTPPTWHAHAAPC